MGGKWTKIRIPFTRKDCHMNFNYYLTLESLALFKFKARRTRNKPRREQRILLLRN